MNDLQSIAASAAAPAQQTPATSLAADFSTFLTLLTTQLRNQDPLNPLDTEKFTEQLVQFAGVEQSIATNDNLKTLIALQSSVDRFSALGLIGAEIETTGDRAAHAGSGATWRYALEIPAEGLTARVLSLTGETIAEFDVNGAAGSHDIRWDGRRADGSAAPAGVYRLQLVSGEGDSAQPVAARGVARVASVDLSGADVALDTGIGSLTLADIRRVSAPGQKGAH